MNAERTAEGWLIVDAEYRNDDPWANDDCWHRGAYWVYSVRGTRLVEQSDADGSSFAAWDRLEAAARAAGLTGTVEVVQKDGRDLGYRNLHTWPTAERLAEVARQDAEYAAQQAERVRLDEADTAAWHAAHPLGYDA